MATSKDVKRWELEIIELKKRKLTFLILGIFFILLTAVLDIVGASFININVFTAAAFIIAGQVVTLPLALLLFVLRVVLYNKRINKRVVLVESYRDNVVSEQ